MHPPIKQYYETLLWTELPLSLVIDLSLSVCPFKPSSSFGYFEPNSTDSNVTETVQNWCEMVAHYGTATLSSAWNATGLHVHRRSVFSHMTFFWGHKTEILFQGWPGCSSGMYALALIFVFFLAVLVEWFNYCSIVKSGTNKVAAGFFKTGMYAVRSGLRYMVMLAVMSFNGGVFLAAVGGHAVGYCLFGSRIFKKSDGSGSEKESDLPRAKF